MKKISKLIQKCQDNNVVDMYETFSELMAEKVINNINARQATIASTILEDCGCSDCQCAKKKKVECSECDGEGCEHCDGKGYHLDESYLYEASPKIKYAKIVKGIRDSQGPFSVVAIKNGKVVAQKNSIKNSKMLPIEVNDMADAHPGATISIESKGGKILNTFKESVELDEGWEKDLDKLVAKNKMLVVRGLKNGKNMHEGPALKSMDKTIRIMFVKFKCDTVEILSQNKVVLTILKKDYLKRNVRESSAMMDEGWEKDLDKLVAKKKMLVVRGLKNGKNMHEGPAQKSIRNVIKTMFVKFKCDTVEILSQNKVVLTILKKDYKNIGQNEGAEMDIAKEKEKMAASQEKIRDFAIQMKKEKQRKRAEA